ncbi:MAG: family 43 glycosylhydrolase, partial [Clostridia bacterium]|nr:family 43 glycosylhydrolase [Clostridia bacterium]
MSFNLVKNPRALTDLWDGREIGDPFLMRFDGKFYLYCSSHGNAGVKCWVSCDMIHFEYYGFVATDPRVNGAYAPEVIYNAGKFWMVTSPRGSGHYLLKADTPVGPFEVITENLGNGIDGSQFVDDDGTSWFYRSSHQGIRVHKMPSPEEIDVRNQPIDASFLNHWTEGPQVIKRDGRYFLTETGNHVCSKGYHIDYCVSNEGPDRGFRRLRDGMLLIETRDEFHALGHSSSCIGPDM